MDNIVYMFGIALLEYDGYCDPMDDSTQYKVVKWKLSDMRICCYRIRWFIENI